MAATVTAVQTGVPGESRFVVADITMDAAYPAGGYPITPASFGLSSIDFLSISGGVRQGTAAGLGICWEWDHVASKLKAWKVGAAVATPLSEVANTDLAVGGAKLRVYVVGRA